MDRLPRSDTLEGLRLLRDAWDEVDIKMHLAGRYKVRAKVFYYDFFNSNLERIYFLFRFWSYSTM